MDATVRTLVVFTLDEQRYALHVAAVERIVRVAEITPLPKAPKIVLGIINIRGRVIPIFDMRKRFGLPERQIRLSDHLIVARSSKRTVGFVADTTGGVVERSRNELTASDGILPHLEYVEGVLKLDDGLVLIHDLDTFLSAVEEQQLDGAMTE